MSAKENFEKLFRTAEEIKTTFEAREQVKAELAAVQEEAKRFFDDTVQKYRAEEEKLNQLIKQEKEKCARLAAEFRELGIEKTKCRIKGIIFQDEQRMKELMEYLSTYDLTMRGMEEARKSIVISAREQQIMEQYRAQGNAKMGEVRTMGNKLSMLLGDLKGGDAMMNCLASFEFIPGRADFMPDEMKQWKDLRKEEAKWGEE